MGLSESVAAPKSSDHFDFPSLNGKKLGYTVYYYPTVDGCEILHHQKDGWNPINSGTNHRFQLVQDFLTIHSSAGQYRMLSWSHRCDPIEDSETIRANMGEMIFHGWATIQDPG